MYRFVTLCLAVCFFVTLGSVCVAEDAAATAGKPGVVAGSVVSASATVEAVNAATREVTLKGKNDRVIVVECGPEVKNFDQIKVGDVVNVDYGESVALFVKAPEGELANTQTEMVKGAPVGAQPAGIGVRVTELQASVEEIDYATRSITLKGAGGRVLSFVVGDEVKRFNEIKKGDHVVARLTQAVAVSVTKP
jgi:hypothetical protein